MDDWWKEDSGRSDEGRDDPLKDKEWNDEIGKERANPERLLEIFEYTLRLVSREKLLKLKADHPEYPGFGAIIDDHLANRFWKMGDDTEDGRAGKSK